MPELATLLPMLVVLLVIGAFAGVVGGLLGVGGGIVLVPAFFYAFGHLGYGGDQLMKISPSSAAEYRASPKFEENCAAPAKGT